MAPTTGDRPFIRSLPFGSMLIQFTSFMFTAGERFIAPMMQTPFIHPKDVRFYLGVLSMLYVGVMIDMLKAAARGEEQRKQWFSRWDSAQGTTYNLWSGFLRNPGLAGNSSILMETLMTQIAPDVNEAAGVPILGKNPTRFRQEKGFEPLLGATYGRGQRLLGVGRDAIQGDWEKALGKLRVMTPIANTIGISVLSAMYEEFE